jgi:(R)-2-hydroxyacyl-CoA dehydratese activating ATPase
MPVAGIDIGSLTAEAVILNGSRVLAAEIMPVRPHPVDSAEQVLARARNAAGLAAGDISYAVSTGYGREKIQEAGLARENVSEISCHGLGAFSLDASVRTVVDIGGQDAKVIRVSETGELSNFVMNDKCAAGTGHFLEVMSRTLGVELAELGPLALAARKPVMMSNRCTIYVETEVIHYLQRGVASADVAGGITRAMAERVFALVRRVDPEREIALTGGVAKNRAVRLELEKMLKTKMIDLALDPQLIGAYGAAVFARRRGEA